MVYSASQVDVLGGLSLSTMRLIYPGQQRAIPLTLTNNTPQPWLAQSSVKPVNFATGEIQDGSVPFIITPPLVKLRPGDKTTLRVRYIGHVLPVDRESVFWVAVRMLPGQTESDSAHRQLSIGVVQQIKLFYRPQMLSAVNLKRASEQLHASIDSRQLILSNPTALYISPGKLTVDGIEVPETERRKMVPPFGQQRYALPETFSGQTSSHRVTWQVIDEESAYTALQQRLIP
jgi:fimbrial chaperone protein